MRPASELVVINVELVDKLLVTAVEVGDSEALETAEKDDENDEIGPEVNVEDVVVDDFIETAAAPAIMTITMTTITIRAILPIPTQAFISKLSFSCANRVYLLKTGSAFAHFIPCKALSSR